MAIWPTFDLGREPQKRPRTSTTMMLKPDLPYIPGRQPWGRDFGKYAGRFKQQLTQPPSDQYNRGGFMEQPTDWTTKEWFPALFELMQGRLAGGRRGLMNQMTGQLGRGLGRHLSRTNVAVPVGADALARRYMSPITQAIEQQDPYNEMLQAMNLAKMFAPGFGAAWEERSPLFQRTRDPMRYLERYMDRFGGGGF